MDPAFSIDAYDFDTSVKSTDRDTKVLQPVRIKRKVQNEWTLMQAIRALDPFQTNLNIVFVW